MDIRCGEGLDTCEGLSRIAPRQGASRARESVGIGTRNGELKSIRSTGGKRGSIRNGKSC